MRCVTNPFEIQGLVFCNDEMLFLMIMGRIHNALFHIENSREISGQCDITEKENENREGRSFSTHDKNSANEQKFCQ